MSSTYAKKLELQIWKMNVNTQKIVRSTLSTFRMVLVGFQV